MSTYTATTVPTQFVEANGIRFAYRRWGKRSGLPLVFNQHFTGHLDNWDPAVLDGLAKEREVIIFNNAGTKRTQDPWNRFHRNALNWCARRKRGRRDMLRAPRYANESYVIARRHRLHS